MIYRGTKRGVESTALYIKETLLSTDHSAEDDFIKYISEIIDPNWSLIQCLNSGVAFHHAGLPKYILNEIVTQFNNNKLKALIFSPTLVEGVNTSAKNVIIADNIKGSADLTGFDVKNIKGRAGRFGTHFIGRVISLVSLPDEDEIDTIQFNLLESTDLSPEENILLNNKDLSTSEKKKRKEFKNILREQNIPYELVKSNKYLSIHNQIRLINYLRNNDDIVTDLYFSGQIPYTHQFDEIIEIIFNYLFSDTERNHRNYDLVKLKRFTKYYLYKNQSIKNLIKIWDYSDNIDVKVRNIFTLVYQYFEFKLPRYLSAFENIYNFVSRNQINLKYVITLLEYGSLQNADMVLKEAGVPPDIINKISDSLSDCNNLDDIKLKLSLHPTVIDNLTSFEKQLLYKYI